MTLIISIIVCLLLSAFFSGSEIAFVSANKLGIAIQNEEGSKKSKLINQFYKKPKRFLSTMLIGNNIALVALTIFMTNGIKQLFPSLALQPLPLLIVCTLIITAIVLLFGEFLPKTFFSLYSNQSLSALTYPLVFFHGLLAFPTWIMTGITNGILRLFKVEAEKLDYRLSEVDLEDYLEENITEESEEIDKEILTNALNLKDSKVRDCMVPRTEIVHFDIQGTIPDLIQVIQETKLSRIILINDDIEEITGYVHHQQLLTNPKTVKSITIDIPFVPEAMNLNDLLHRFIREQKSIAVVVDEFGSTAGIITLEDILEEIFGEIEDEHDSEDYLEEKITDNFFRFSGRLEIDHLNERYESLNIPEGEYQTLSGFLVTHTGKIPEVGEEILYENTIYAIEEMSDTKIEIVNIKVLDDITTESEEDEDV